MRDRFKKTNQERIQKGKSDLNWGQPFDSKTRKMSVGKYKGRKLSKVPVEYLRWMLDNWTDMQEFHRQIIVHYWRQKIN